MRARVNGEKSQTSSVRSKGWALLHPRWLRRCRRKCWAGSLAVQVYGVAETRGAAAATNSPSWGVHGE